jgi:hypothetical protein
MPLCDFHVLRELKGTTFGLDTDIKATVVQWLLQQPSQFFEGETTGLCINGMLANSWGLFLMASTPSAEQSTNGFHLNEHHKSDTKHPKKFQIHFNASVIMETHNKCIYLQHRWAFHCAIHHLH